MKVQLEIDPNCKETQIIIRTNELTEEINELIQRTSASSTKMLAGFVADEVQLIDTAKIIRIYAADKKVFAQTQKDEYIIRMPLYKLEERLDQALFVRISQSEIVNLKAIKKMDLSFTGTIAMTLSTGITTYVSRRYVSKIKKILGI